MKKVIPFLVCFFPLAVCAQSQSTFEMAQEKYKTYADAQEATQNQKAWSEFDLLVANVDKSSIISELKSQHYNSVDFILDDNVMIKNKVSAGGSSRGIINNLEYKDMSSVYYFGNKTKTVTCHATTTDLYIGAGPESSVQREGVDLHCVPIL